MKKATFSSKSSSNAQCQKCLKHGHWTYECKNPVIVYKSRPTRTQQLKNIELSKENKKDQFN
ncbi:hypothetical protein PNEG_01387 [Pneumocystis murina B123]|uniref:Uncharacterized protein n=1 Tax=Pneumocystis murina (strain B123) TaxID=1069680 RepID=M7NN45_PNEMU|nr:hypothetical protein PNEG_01387 [Pneumocystis murina B123]EMR10108.1 hypothetical protein PNEG_01387 [Pneumocystis murina B123]